MNFSALIDMVLNPTNGASVILIGLLFIGLISAFRAQRIETFSWADMLKDNQGKPSAFRLGIVVSLVMASWVLVVATIKSTAMTAQELTDLFLIYLAVWSGSPIISKALDWILLKYSDKLPKPNKEEEVQK